MRNLGKNSVLGYESFFGNTPSEFSACGTSLCVIAYLNKDDFLKSLQNYPEDYETFCTLRDSLLLYDKRIDIRCTSCGEYSHSFKNCPVIHLELPK